MPSQEPHSHRRRHGLRTSLSPFHDKLGIQARLENELARLKRKMNLGQELSVEWVPNPEGKLHGEVVGSRIRIYDLDEKEALKTLRHEFADSAVSSCAEPFKEVTNLLIGFINKQAYARKEKVADALATLLERRDN